MSEHNLCASQPAQINLDELGDRATVSTSIAKVIVAGLPMLGLVAALFCGLPLFAAFMTGTFLMGTAVLCRKALTTFTGDVLRLLVTARFTIVLVVGALFFATHVAAWMAIVSGVLLWLAADRLLGRRALHQLWKRVNEER